MDNKVCFICVIIALVCAVSGAFIQNLIDKCRLEYFERKSQKFKEMIEIKMKDLKVKLIQIILIMFNRNNKNNKQTKPLFQMKTSYDKVAKVMAEPPKDYDTIKNLIEDASASPASIRDKKENILDLNIKSSKNINLTKSKNKKKENLNKKKI